MESVDAVRVGHGGGVDGGVVHGRGVGLRQGLGHDGLAGGVGVGGGGVGVGGVGGGGVGVRRGVRGVREHRRSVRGVAGDLLGENGGYAGGGAVELGLVGLDGVERLPRVVFGGVDGLAVELGVLVVGFAGGVDGGAGVVGHLNVGIDGSALEVPGGDGGQGGGGVGDGYWPVGDGQRRGVSQRQRRGVAMGVGCGQQGAGRRGCGAGEDGGGDNL